MRNWQKAALILTLLVMSVAGLWRLRLEGDILATLPQELPEVQGLKLLRNAFKGGTDLLIGLETGDAQRSAALAESLAKTLGEERTLVSGVRSAGTFADPKQAGALLAWALQNASPERLQAWRRDHLEGEKLNAHLESVMHRLAESPDPAEVQRWSYDPLGMMECLEPGAMASLRDAGFELESPDGTFRVLLVSPRDELGGYREAAKWLGEVRRIIADWRDREKQAGGDVKIHLTGEPAFVAETGSGIEKDMRATIGITEVLITLLFWLMFRRLVPLLWIQLLLVLIMILTLALASLLLGSVSVMSMGFAAIVLGIVVDYAVLILQESRDHPAHGAKALRRLAAPGIIAGAATTSVVFLSLIFSGLPGLASLGVMVALGVVVGLGVMLICMPVLVAGNEKRAASDNGAGEAGASLRGVSHKPALIGTFLLVAGVVGIHLWKGLPAYETGAEALRPTKSEAVAGWDVIQDRLGKAKEARVPILVQAHWDSGTLKRQALDVELLLAKAKSDGLILKANLPVALLPDAEAQRENRATVEWLVQNEQTLRDAVLASGFTEESMMLFRELTGVWRRALAVELAWPQRVENSEAADVLGRLLGQSEYSSGGPDVILGSVTFSGEPGVPDMAKLKATQKSIGRSMVYLTGWESLGSALSDIVRRDVTRMTVPLVAVLIFMLALTFRNWRDVLLSVVLLALGIAALSAMMAALGLSWNLASIAAFPLLLGTGIDYGIHIMLAMAREGNDIARVRATTARAVFFSGMTTVIGFASLIFAGNKGVASLGMACCAGTVWIMLLVLWLLPHWRVWLFSLRKPPTDQGKVLG